MSRSYRDFVEDAKIMLSRVKSASDREVIQYLNANEVFSQADAILATAKAELEAEEDV